VKAAPLVSPKRHQRHSFKRLRSCQLSLITTGLSGSAPRNDGAHRGSGHYRPAPAIITLTSYTGRICEIASEQSEPVILAGHSMGGIAITQAAETVLLEAL
jgi:pimeloyl-ACP methyl ester carboxylesterase